MYSQRSSHTHLQAAHSSHTDQSLQKSVPALPKKNFKIFFPLLLKKLIHPTLKPTMQTVGTYGHDNWTTEKEAHAHNNTLPSCGFQCNLEVSANNLLYSGLTVLCPEIPHERQA